MDVVVADLLTEPVAVYVRWNRAIARHFFTPEQRAQPVRLAFDEATAAGIARGLDEPFDGLRNALHALIHPALANPFERIASLKTDPREHPAIALLATQVLAASKMGEDPDIDPSRFWSIFFDLVTREIVEAQKDELDRLWIDCERHYCVDLNGKYGRLTLPPADVPLKRKRHINLPLWQSSLREIDREQLRRRFAMGSRAELRASAARLPAIVRTWPELNRTLKNTLRWAAENPAYEHALGLELELIRDAARDGGPEGRGHRRGRSSRLRLVGRGEKKCYLQERAPTGHWTDVRDPDGRVSALDSGELRLGIDPVQNGVGWRGAERLAFFESEGVGWVYERGVVTGEADVLLMYLTPDQPSSALMEPSRWTSEAIGAELADDYSCVRGVLDPDVDVDLAELFGIDLQPERTIALEGGLSAGRRGSYIVGAPPRVRVLSEKVEGVVVDGLPMSIGADRVVSLEDDLPPGEHVVAAGRDELTFALLQPESEGPHGTLGYDLGDDGMLQVGQVADLPGRLVLIGARLESGT